ncbi:MAG: hypothetical protein JXR51_03430 [Bacteroidales bacterium]|nr:hypothetical protein [Bacteroidales bacterium]MBN2756204.1 hypothetical protein [Bacteroidales bacterium]
MDEIIYLIRTYLFNSDENQIQKLNSKLKEAGFENEELNIIQKNVFEVISNESVIDKVFLSKIEKIFNILNHNRVNKINRDIVCFTPFTDCINKILDFLNSAKKNIAICVFTISDDRITNKLIECKKRGISIKIITDNDKQNDLGSDINFLSEEGIEVKIDTSKHHMHNKFAIVDNIKFLTGSYNWTRSAAIYNQENFLISSNKKTVQKYQNEFDRLWEIMTPHL